MAIQTIKNGGFVGEEIEKINANFSELNTNKANTSAIPTKTSQLTNDSNFVNQTQLNTAIDDINVPTKTSQLTNDSNFVTTSSMNTALGNKVDKVTGKQLSTNDYTTAEKTKLAGLSAPATVNIATSAWTSASGAYTFTTAANSRKPVAVMRKNGTSYGVALVDVALNGSNIVITASEAFEGYIIVV